MQINKIFIGYCVCLFSTNIFCMNIEENGDLYKEKLEKN